MVAAIWSASVAQAGGAARAVEDARLIREQVERCRAILERMRADAGDTAGEGFASVPVDGAGRQRGRRRRRRRASRVRPEIAAAVVDRMLTVPPRAVGQALRR